MCRGIACRLLLDEFCMHCAAWLYCRRQRKERPAIGYKPGWFCMPLSGWISCATYVLETMTDAAPLRYGPCVVGMQSSSCSSGTAPVHCCGSFCLSGGSLFLSSSSIPGHGSAVTLCLVGDCVRVFAGQSKLLDASQISSAVQQLEVAICRGCMSPEAHGPAWGVPRYSWPLLPW